MSVQPPPVWEHLLLENPWPAVFTLGALSVVLWVVGQRRRNAKLRYVAVGAIAVAAGMYLLARFVETDREAIAKQTRSLIEATAPLEMRGVDEQIANGAFVSGPDGTPWVAYDGIRPELERVVQRYRVEGHTIRALGVEVDVRGTRGRSVVELRTSLPESGTGLPVETLWELHWRKEGEGRWRVAEIRWLELMKREPERGIWR